MLGNGQLNKNAVDGGVVVEAFNVVEEFTFRDIAAIALKFACDIGLHQSEDEEIWVQKPNGPLRRP